MLKVAMEKIQIAKYGMMQVTAVVYAILSCGSAVKVNNTMLPSPDVLPRSAAFCRALFIRDYGILFLVAILAWAIAISYLSSPLSKWDVDEDDLCYSGLALAVVFAIVGTYIAIAAAVLPFSLPLHS